ncbi:MAG: division/cell wall cluster transcriptional repressor MraZ [Endomicrobiales bacterium]|jgi:MraZ protein
MYIGQFVHTLDAKNRVFLPARFRNKNNLFVITRGLEPCLNIYDGKMWAKVLEKLDNLAIADKTQERGFKRAFLSGAHEAVCDGQGRILIPQNLKEYAQVLTEIIIIGVGNRLELWDAAKWENYYTRQADPAFKSLAGQLEI